MSSVQVRLPEKVVKDIDALGKQLESSRSEVIRKALEEGLGHLKAELALQDYLENRITLCEAASRSSLSVREFADYASDKGIPFMRYPAQEAERDVEELEKKR